MSIGKPPRLYGQMGRVSHGAEGKFGNSISSQLAASDLSIMWDPIPVNTVAFVGILVLSSLSTIDNSLPIRV